MEFLYQITGNFGTIERESKLYYAEGVREAFEFAKIDGLTKIKKYIRTSAGEGFDKMENLNLGGRLLN